MDSSISIRKFYELVDLYKYGSIDGEKTELVIRPLYENGKYSDTKRIISIGLQGGLSRDRDTFVADIKDFDTKVMPYLINYFEGDEKLEFNQVSRSTMENITSKSIYETETGNLFYLETLNNSLFDIVEGRREIVKKNTNKRSISKLEKDYDEILQYAKKTKDRNILYDEKYSENEKLELNQMFSLLAANNIVNISNSSNSRLANEKLIDEYINNEKFNEELKEKINRDKSKLAIFLGAYARINKKLDLNDNKIREILYFANYYLINTEYFDLRRKSKFSLMSEEQKINSRSKQSEIIKLREKVLSDDISNEEKRLVSEICDELLQFLELKDNKKDISKEINRVEDTNLVLYNDVVLNDYFELQNSIDLILGGKLDNENYEFIIEREGNIRKVRLSIINSLSRGDEFNFIFTDVREFDNRIKTIIDSLMNNKELGNTNVLDVSNQSDLTSNGNKILLKGYDKDFYEREEKVLKATSFDKLHEYVINYKIRTNPQNELDIFERDTLIPYNPINQREKLDIEFATYWNVMAGIFETPGDKMIGEVYAFGKGREILFNIMNEYFTNIILNDEEFDLLDIKRKFAESQVENSLVIFNRLFRNQYYIDYVLKYYKSIVNEKNIDNQYDKEELKELEQPILDYALEQDNMISNENNKINISPSEEEQELISLKEQIVNALWSAVDQSKKEELKKGAYEQANLLNLENEIIKSAEEEAKRLDEHNKLIKEADIQAKLLRLKEEIIASAETQARELFEQDNDKELINAINISSDYLTKENPSVFTIYFRTPDEAELTISTVFLDNEKILFKKNYSKDKIMELSTLLTEEYKKYNKINYLKPFIFDTLNTNKSGLLIFGTDDNTFRISKAPNDVVEKYNNEFINEKGKKVVL